MDEKSEVVPGLFGWAPACPRGPGRPAFEATPEKAREVMGLFARGRTKRDAARVIGCDVKTLEKHFSAECAARDFADEIVRSRLLGVLLGEAEKGNVGAVKQAERMIDADRLRMASAKFGDAPRQPKAEAKGKKQLRREAAYDAGKGDEGWGDLLHDEEGAATAH